LAAEVNQKSAAAGCR